MESDSDSDSDYDGGDGGRTSTSIQRCLGTIGIDAAKSLSGCTNLTEEFTAIKKAYFRKILVCHPDKGGDAAVFRDVNSSFELIRKLYEDKAVTSFAAAAESTQDRYDYDYGSKGSSGSGSRGGGGGGGGARGGSGAGSAPSQWKSWQYYYDAAQEEVPHYKVELARSNRSKCNGTKTARQCTEDGLIGKGEIRIGSLDAQAGSYARWVHLECWRVPSRIWQGLPQDDADRSIARCVAALSGMNEVNLTGFNDLSPHDQRRVAAHAMQRGNWARLQGRRAPLVSDLGGGVDPGSQPQEGGAASSSGGFAGGPSYAGGAGYGGGDAGYAGGGASSMMAPSSGAELSLARYQGSSALAAPRAAAAGRGFFVVPRPGVNGARPDFLKGKTVVMTGIFPEIGGGIGLNLGKDRLRKMCEDFGARVTSSISGKTDILIVGKEPGASKVGKARDSAKCQLISLADLTLSIQGEQQLETAADATEQIESFSAGYLSGRMLAMGGGAPRRPLKPAAAAAPKPKKAAKKRAPPASAKPKPKPKPRAKKSPAAKQSAAGSKKGKTAASKPARDAKKKPPARRGRPRKKADGAAGTAAAH
eukprot:g4179.t1